MTDTDQHSVRRVLRREMAGTVGLLTDEDDFRAMRRYGSFAFHDHTVYLQQIESLLRIRALQGTHTTVALFDPEEYAGYCAAVGLDPDRPASRSRFTAELASTGATVPYEGQPLTDLVPTLVGEAVRQATWEYASTLLARLGPCPTCAEDTGRAAFSRASDLVVRVLAGAPAGHRHLVCSVVDSSQTLVAVLHADRDAEGATQLDETEALEFTTVLAVGLATRSPGGLVMRTTTADSPDRVYGWRLYGDDLRPLTAGEVFDAYCTDADTGDLVAPESDVDYCAPPDLEDPGTHRGHHH